MNNLKPQGAGGSPSRVPDLSLVLPCYNEEGCLELTVPPLIEAFHKAGIHIEVVLVDNGSKDRTSDVTLPWFPVHQNVNNFTDERRTKWSRESR